MTSHLCLYASTRQNQNQKHSQFSITATIPVNATNLLSHAFNSAIMLLDLLIVGYPMRIFHMLQPIVFGNMFGLFSYIYYLFDGKNM